MSLGRRACLALMGAGAGTPPGSVGQRRPNLGGTNPVGKELDLAVKPAAKVVG